MARSMNGRQLLNAAAAIPLLPGAELWQLAMGKGQGSSLFLEGNRAISDSKSEDAMSTLTKIEEAILDILSDFPNDEISAQELRTLVQNRGFRRSAPAFVFTMENLADKGLVACREEVRMTDMAEVRDRFYQIRQKA